MQKIKLGLWLCVLMIVIVAFLGCTKITSTQNDTTQTENVSEENSPSIDSKEALRALQTAINFMESSSQQLTRLTAEPLNYKTYFDPNQKETLILFEVNIKSAAYNGEPVKFYIITVKKENSNWRFFYSGEELDIAAGQLFENIEAVPFPDHPIIKGTE